MEFSLIKLKLFWVLQQRKPGEYECTWTTNVNKEVLFIVDSESFYLIYWRQKNPTYKHYIIECNSYNLGVLKLDLFVKILQYRENTAAQLMKLICSN